MSDTTDTSADDDVSAPPPEAGSVRHFAEVLREKGYHQSADLMEGLLARAEKAEAERDRLLKALGDKDEALLHIAQWAEAYPEDIFPPVDVASAREKLGDDALFSRLHAEWARHLCKGIGAIARAALEETGHD